MKTHLSNAVLSAAGKMSDWKTGRGVEERRHEEDASILRFLVASDVLSRHFSHASRPLPFLCGLEPFFLSKIETTGTAPMREVVVIRLRPIDFVNCE